MKRLILLLLAFALPLAAQSPTASVNLSVTDADGQTWNNGTYKLALVPHYTSGLLFNGTKLPISDFAGTLSSTGTVALTGVPRGDQFFPANTQWQVTVTPQATGGTAYTTLVQITQPTVTLAITPPAIRFAANNSGTVSGYADGEVTPTPTIGQKYFNLTSQLEKVWNGTAFQANGGSGGGGGGTVDNTARTSATAALTASQTAQIAADAASTTAQSASTDAAAARTLAAAAISRNGDTVLGQLTFKANIRCQTIGQTVCSEDFINNTYPGAPDSFHNGPNDIGKAIEGCMDKARSIKGTCDLTGLSTVPADYVQHYPVEDEGGETVIWPAAGGWTLALPAVGQTSIVDAAGATVSLPLAANGCMFTLYDHSVWRGGGIGGSGATTFQFTTQAGPATKAIICEGLPDRTTKIFSYVDVVAGIGFLNIGAVALEEDFLFQNLGDHSSPGNGLYFYDASANNTTCRADWITYTTVTGLQCYSAYDNPSGGPNLSYNVGGTPLLVTGYNSGLYLIGDIFNAPGKGHPNVMFDAGATGFGVVFGKNALEGNGDTDNTAVVINNSPTLDLTMGEGNIFVGSCASLNCPNKYDVENHSTNFTAPVGWSHQTGGYLNDLARSTIIPPPTIGTKGAAYTPDGVSSYLGQVRTHQQNDTFHADRAETGCTVNGFSFNSGFDCAIGRAQYVMSITGQPQTVELDSGVYSTQTGLQMSLSDANVINIVGKGKSDFGGGTTIKLTAPISTAVITYPPLPLATNYGYWSNLRLENFSIDANGLAPAAVDLSALRVPNLSHLSFTGVTENSTKTWVRIGDNTIPNGGDIDPAANINGHVFQGMLNDLFIYYPSHGPGASITATTSSGGSIAFTVPTNTGLYYRPHGGLTVPVYIKGATAQTIPCYDGSGNPTLGSYTGTLAPDTNGDGLYYLASINTVTAATGCSGALSVAAPDMPMAGHGFEISNTDASIYDLQDDAVGVISGLTDRGSTGTTFYHPHLWNTGTLIEAWSIDALVDPEMDSPYVEGIKIRYAAGGTPCTAPNAGPTCIGNPTLITRPRLIPSPTPSPAFNASRLITFNANYPGTVVNGQACIGVTNGDCTNFQTSPDTVAANLQVIAPKVVTGNVTSSSGDLIIQATSGLTYLGGTGTASSAALGISGYTVFSPFPGITSLGNAANPFYQATSDRFMTPTTPTIGAACAPNGAWAFAPDGNRYFCPPSLQWILDSVYSYVATAISNGGGLATFDLTAQNYTVPPTCHATAPYATLPNEIVSQGTPTTTSLQVLTDDGTIFVAVSCTRN